MRGNMFTQLLFQQGAIDELKEVFVELWKNPNRQLPLVFKSPTGSGKTFVMAHFINDLAQLPNWDCKKAFIWITFSDDIAMQSKTKFEDYLENNLKCSLLTVDDISNGRLKKNDILFMNWQKIVSRAAESRILRRPEEIVMQKESGKYFEDFIDQAHSENIEIILVVDEAHKNRGTHLAQGIIDYINPKIIVEVSATPEKEPSVSDVRNNRAGFVEVNREEVVDEGLIKDRIAIQTYEDLNKHRSQNLDEVLLDLGSEKRNFLANKFKKLGKKVNPLMIIQLPNDDRRLQDRGEKTKEEVVIEYLRQKGIHENQIALWFDNHKKNLEFISDNNNSVNYMLFKQAAGTGWDCPRAHVLVMFREITSHTFYVQTIGRILRMPEPCSKEDYRDHLDLRTGYLYTNYEREDIDIPDASNNNKPAINFTYPKKEFQKDCLSFKLPSAFMSRADYGDLRDSAKFQVSFIKSMNKYFGVIGSDNSEDIQTKLKSKGMSFNAVVTNKLIVDAEYEDFERLSFDFAKKGEDVNLEMSQNDAEKLFNFLCYEILKEQTDEDAKIANLARSWSPLKSAIRIWLRAIFNTDSNRMYRIFIRDVQKQGSSAIRPAITRSLKEYKPILTQILKEKRKNAQERTDPTFIIQNEYSFTEDYEEIKQKLCILDKCYMRKEYEGRQNELRFIKYLESKTSSIKWWFKNGDHGLEYFAIRYMNTRDNSERLFYPDWIIQFKGGKVGIFDTKGGRTLDTEGRANALAKKIKELGKKYIGGIVKYQFAEHVLYYCDSENYNDQTESKNKWIPTEALFK